MIAETTKSLRGRLSKLRDVIKSEYFKTYIDEEEILRLSKQESYDFYMEA
jgi:hypothetical protein